MQGSTSLPSLTSLPLTTAVQSTLYTQRIAEAFHTLIRNNSGYISDIGGFFHIRRFDDLCEFVWEDPRVLPRATDIRAFLLGVFAGLGIHHREGLVALVVFETVLRKKGCKCVNKRVFRQLLIIVCILARKYCNDEEGGIEDGVLLLVESWRSVKRAEAAVLVDIDWSLTLCYDQYVMYHECLCVGLPAAARPNLRMRWF